MNLHDREKLVYPFESSINDKGNCRVIESHKLNKFDCNVNNVGDEVIIILKTNTSSINRTGQTNLQKDNTFLDILRNIKNDITNNIPINDSISHIYKDLEIDINSVLVILII